MGIVCFLRLFLRGKVLSAIYSEKETETGTEEGAKIIVFLRLL